MTSEVEVTVRVMTPHHGQEPLYTAEKFIETGEMADTTFQALLMRNYLALTTRAANAVMLFHIAAAEESAAEAQEKDDADYRAQF